MSSAENRGTNIHNRLAAVQSGVELQESFLGNLFGLHRITKGRDHIAINGIAPLLKIAGDFLFERQSVLLEVEKLSFKTSFRRSGSRNLLPQAMKQHDSPAVSLFGPWSDSTLGNGALKHIANRPMDDSIRCSYI